MGWFRRVRCLFSGHVEKPGYRVSHPDIISMRCERCRQQWLEARASGL